MYYLCSENKGADQLHGYREADLRLCFRICKKPVFSRRGSTVSLYFLKSNRERKSFSKNTKLHDNFNELACNDNLSEGLIYYICKLGL